MSLIFDFDDRYFYGDQRPKKDGWAPGKYTNECHKCGRQFTGDKRASTCADCAYGEPGAN